MAEEQEEVRGALYASLARSNKQIREERGTDLVEELRVSYERRVQDLEMDISKILRNQKRNFDFGGTSTTSLVVKDVNSKEIMDVDLAIELELHNLNVKLGHVKRRLKYLFVNPETQE